MPFGFGGDGAGEPGAWGEDGAEGGETPVEGGIPLGALVQVEGLVAAAQHNGKLGVVRGYDEESGRYVVQVSAALRSIQGGCFRSLGRSSLQSCGEVAGSLARQVQGGSSMKVKPENLKPASAAQAQSMGGAGGAPMPSVAEVEAKLRSMSVGQLRCASLSPYTHARGGGRGGGGAESPRT